MSGKLVVTQEDKVVVLTLHNPKKRNALDPEICAQLTAAITSLPTKGRVAVLTGDGSKAFCAGFDLDSLGGDKKRMSSAEASLQAEHAFDTLIDTVAACPIPIVCALNGVAMGGGLELAATCDVRVAHPEVMLGMPPAKLGIVYSPRGLLRFSALVGEGRARELFLCARTIDATEAHKWGLVNHLVGEIQVLPRAMALADAMSELAPIAVQGMRRSFEMILRSHLMVDAQSAGYLLALRQHAFQSADAAEARKAFAEKRKPVFKGE
jgi:enoyl-CoA hydratase/carnithine racemase